MLIIGIGFFVTTFLLSHRTSALYTNKETEAKDVSDATSESYTSQSRFSSPRKAKDVALKEAEETVASDIQDSSDTSGNSSDVVDSTQNEESTDSLTSQSESQDDDASRALENAAKYAKLKEPFQQIQNLWAQSDSITNELMGLMSSAGAGGRDDADEYGKKLDERNAIDRQILAICREVQKIVPDVIQIREDSRMWSDVFNFYRLSYGVVIHRDKLEESLGKIPQDIDALLPKKVMLLIMPEDENFSYYEARKELDRRRQAAQNR